MMNLTRDTREPSYINLISWVNVKSASHTNKICFMGMKEPRLLCILSKFISLRVQSDGGRNTSYPEGKEFNLWNKEIQLLQNSIYSRSCLSRVQTRLIGSSFSRLLLFFDRFIRLHTSSHSTV